MSVDLRPPVSNGPVDHRILREALTTGPAFIAKRHPQRAGWLWHRPRAGYLSLREWAPDDIVTTYDLWCGQFARKEWAEVTDDLPAGAVVCATCDGRAMGAGQIPGPDTYRTSFTARWATPPRCCPGSGRSGLWTEVSRSVGRCCVCGAVESLRCMGGIWNGGIGIVRHQPATDLLTVRCDFHGWRQLVRAGATVICRCEVPA